MAPKGQNPRQSKTAFGPNDQSLPKSAFQDFSPSKKAPANGQNRPEAALRSQIGILTLVKRFERLSAALGESMRIRANPRGAGQIHEDPGQSERP
ncbi:MAG: hypothetical protein LBF38_10015 [Deltaproteobacteria bacterium]|nr:hypothetical protein [Deltaproteobacteria bacterium]